MDRWKERRIWVMSVSVTPEFQPYSSNSNSPVALSFGSSTWVFFERSIFGSSKSQVLEFTKRLPDKHMNYRCSISNVATVYLKEISSKLSHGFPLSSWGAWWWPRDDEVGPWQFVQVRIEPKGPNHMTLVSWQPSNEVWKLWSLL